MSQKTDNKQLIDLDKSRKYFCSELVAKAHKILGARHMEPIKVSKIKKLRSDLNKATIQERIVDYQLKPDRADLIVPALDIYLFILKQMKSKQVIVPKIGLADGMIYDMHFNHLQSKK